MLLRLRGVSRTHGDRRILAPVDLDVGAGECVALLGHNGAGKSTLMRLAAGRDRPTTGTVEFDGAPMDEDDPRTRARVALVGDALACYPDLTVRQHLELVAAGHRVPDADARITAALATHRLSARADALPAELSSGQTQELLLAAALLRPTDLLLLDEPEQRLDPDARQRLATVLADRLATGTSLLLVTHHRELAAALAHRTYVLADGTLTPAATPAT
ncbi:ATP-binding cassette domain-containing protein [Streptomyces sp. NPDC049879]|uniref:ABC transporter ATP-binding protein n=1 Tax=Streptomyces sp. NPDC049879 TaxID=3365598 RepID=UPI0037A06FA9